MTDHAIATSESMPAPKMREPSWGFREHAPPENFEIWNLGSATSYILRIVFMHSEHQKMLFKVGIFWAALSYVRTCCHAYGALTKL